MVSGISVGERSRSFNRGAAGHVVEANRLIRVAQRKHNFYPVILAGGRGTRFWPLSRKRRAKQLLSLASVNRFWIITNNELQREINRQLPRVPKQRVLAEPAGRNTAPAIGLA